MRHAYFRFFIGIVWIIAAVVSLIGGGLLFGLFYAFIGAIFLGSGYSIWNKEKDNRR